MFIQYTALAWSRRGFPFRVLPMLLLLRLRGARCALIFHDPKAYAGVRVIDHFRRAVQQWTMKRAYQLAHRSIFAIAIESVDWLPPKSKKATFIAIGANVSKNDAINREGCSAARESRTVAVFGVTGGDALEREVRDVAHAVRYASMHGRHLTLVVFGRNSKEAEDQMRRALEGTSVLAEFLGVILPQDVLHVLSCSDVLLFVRGSVSSSRSSALAGVACGLPIVGYRGPETGFPVTEAGLELVIPGNLDALGESLNRVLNDDELRQRLSRKSLYAYA
ncbi:MAG: glycosyltransferase, partial [Silvibacterium sp.]